MDFGTCNSVIAKYNIQNNKSEAILNIISNKLTTPTYLNLNDNQIGFPVKNLPIQDQSIIHSFKRLIGRKYTDKEVQETIKRVNYKITQHEDGILINDKYKPDDIASLFMKQFVNQCQLKQDSHLVVTVPAYYSSLQKELTMQAANKAGLIADRLIAEPTAAALQYNSQFPSKNNEIIMVCDLGAGTLDVSLIEKIDDCYNVIAVSGDNFFGGNDFSQVIRDHIQNKYQKQINLSLAEEIKKKLDTQQSYQFDNIKIQRNQIENEYNALLDKLERPIRQVLLDSNLQTNQVDKILLVGGQTRGPEVQKRIQQIMQKKPLQSLNPDHCVAQGAAIQHAIVQKQIDSILLLDATPFSLGIETVNGIFSKIINRNATLPAKQSEIFTTTYDNQKYVQIKIFQGESQIAANNLFLNEFQIEIEPQPKGVPRINVEFIVNQNGMVEVKATDMSNGKGKQCQVQVIKSNKSNNQNKTQEQLQTERNESLKRELIYKISQYNDNISKQKGLFGKKHKLIKLTGKETLEQLQMKSNLIK